MPPRGNLTGFDPQKLAAASGRPANDPWKRVDAWRYTGPFTRWNRFKGALPGLAWGTGAFAVYLVYDIAVNGGQKGGHGQQDGGHH